MQNNISGIHLAQGELPEALTMLDDVLPIFEKALGQDHLHVADTKNKCAAFFFPMACVNH